MRLENNNTVYTTQTMVNTVANANKELMQRTSREADAKNALD